MCATLCTETTLTCTCIVCDACDTTIITCATHMVRPRTTTPRKWTRITDTPIEDDNKVIFYL